MTVLYVIYYSFCRYPDHLVQRYSNGETIVRAAVVLGINIVLYALWYQLFYIFQHWESDYVSIVL